jgi:hypothetical protein
MRINENDIPNISAECAKCFFIYGLKYGLACPRCAGVGVRWARLVTAAEKELRAGLDAWGLTEKDNRDISELDKMFALGSAGSRP